MSLPNKRAATSSTSNNNSNNCPPMKKAKSQAVACSMDTAGKNGVHHHPDFNNREADVVFDPNSMTLDEDLKSDEQRTPAAANLARKKAQPPQPAKKLVIKLVKGTVYDLNCRFPRCCLVSVV